MVKKENEALVETPSVENRFYEDVSAILREGRGKARAVVNYAMVETYWRVGRRIVEQEQKGKERAEYGEYLIVNLSRYLGDNWGKGFSIANLKNFRRFYLTFPSFDELATHCVANLGWSHLRLIIRLENQNERNYYLKETAEQNWSVRILDRNIKSGYHRRLLSTQVAPPEKKTSSPPFSDFIKDPYVLEFLGLPEDGGAHESTVETAIVSHLQQFLMELGKGFSFVGRQFRVSTETSHFYIDLVFYNYLLKCFVVIDLKTTKLTHQDIGQMDMYVRMFDELKRGVDDNPTLGIILCADKDETIVKYSMLKESRQIFASKYRQILPTEDELATELARNVKMLQGNGNE
jgi:predicted nuclease of restriction endonuclease-like (RecB) superfamily